MARFTMKAATTAATTAKMPVAMDGDGSDNCSDGGREKDYCSDSSDSDSRIQKRKKIAFCSALLQVPEVRRLAVSLITNPRELGGFSFTCLLRADLVSPTSQYRPLSC